MHRRLVVLVATLAAVAFGPSRVIDARPQVVTTSAVVGVDVTGMTKLSRDQIVAMSGLSVGRPVSATELDAVVAKLLATGLFSAVHYSVQPTKAGLRVLLDVAEPLWTMAVLLDNFIWFSDEEIYRAIAVEIPTFDGAVPDTAGALTTVNNVLQQMLDARHIPGRVEHSLHVDLDVGRQTQRFAVTGVQMPVCAIHFAGASPANDAALAKGSKFVLADQYSRERLFRMIKGDLVPIYQQRGYLQAEFHAPTVTLLSAPPCNGGADVTIVVNEGPVFSVKDVVWVGNTAVATKALDSALGVKPGEIADGVKFGTGLGAAKKLYEAAGYLDVAPGPTMRLNAAEKLVTYQIEVTEGSVYTMGTLSVSGGTEAERTRIARAWPIRAAAPFNMTLARSVRAVGLGASRPVTITIAPDQKAHVVNVTIAEK